MSGDPSPEELAALLAVVAAWSGGADEGQPVRSAWRDPARLVRRPIQPGPGSWRTSALPG